MKTSTVLVVLSFVASSIAPTLRTHAQEPPQPQPDQQPPVIIGGGGGGGAAGGGTGGGGGAGGGSGGAYDGYNDIDWDGPDQVPFTPLVFKPVAVDGLISVFKLTTAGLAASVPAQPRLYPDAIDSIEIEIEKRGSNAAVIAEMKQEAATPEGRGNLADVAAAAALARHFDYAFAALFARVKAVPDDPTAIFGMASLLVQRKMPNEALAMLDHLNQIKKFPDAPFGYQPEASVDYLRGYALMMIGRLQQSTSLLASAFAADPTLTDASYTLAVAQAALGQNPRKALLQGMLRPYHGPLMYCGDKYDKDPLEVVVDDENVAPPADRIFDLSKGTPGVLPVLAHPASGEQLVALLDEYVNVKHKEMEDEVKKHAARADALYDGLSARLRGPDRDPQDITAKAIVDLMDEANACLKPLQRMRKARNEALDALGDKINATGKTSEADYRAVLSVREPEDAIPIWKSINDKALSSRHGMLGQYDALVRAEFKSWHKYATGLAGHLTDPDWREYADEKIRTQEALEWLQLYGTVIEGYAAGGAFGKEVYDAVQPAQTRAAVAAEALWRCDTSHQKASVEAKVITVKGDEWPGAPKGIPDLGVAMKANCDKVAMEVDGKISVGAGPFKVGLGAFLETSVDRAGDITLYGGPKFSAEASPVPSATTGGSVKDGLYMTFDEFGLKEIGGKIDFSQSQSAGSAKLSIKDDDMKFKIWAAPPRPPKFDAKTGLKIWKNVNDLK